MLHLPYKKTSFSHFPISYSPAFDIAIDKYTILGFIPKTQKNTQTTKHLRVLKFILLFWLLELHLTPYVISILFSPVSLALSINRQCFDEYFFFPTGSPKVLLHLHLMMPSMTPALWPLNWLHSPLPD